MKIKNIVIVYSQSHENTDQFKLNVRLKCVTIKPQKSTFFLIDKHCVVRIKELSNKQLEELFLNPAFINSKFSNELDSQGFAKVQVFTD